MQTGINRMDKQGPKLYNTGSNIQYPVINHNGKEYVCIYVCITESPFCTAEMNVNYK